MYPASHAAYPGKLEPYQGMAHIKNPVPFPSTSEDTKTQTLLSGGGVTLTTLTQGGAEYH